jgi:hypothetical protein
MFWFSFSFSFSFCVSLKACCVDELCNVLSVCSCFVCYRYLSVYCVVVRARFFVCWRVLCDSVCASAGSFEACICSAAGVRVDKILMHSSDHRPSASDPDPSSRLNPCHLILICHDLSSTIWRQALRRLPRAARARTEPTPPPQVASACSWGAAAFPLCQGGFVECLLSILPFHRCRSIGRCG